MSAIASDFQKNTSNPISQNRVRRSTVLRVGKSLAAITIASLLCLGLQRFVSNQLGNEAFATGYTLLAVVMALSMLGVRKRLPSVNLGSVTIWQTTHHYLGLFCLIAYCSHAGILANGWLESTLAALFWTILLTGFMSWYINRSSPRLLRAAGQAILRSDIPEARIAVAEQAYQIALTAAGSSNAFVIADFYQATLSKFFTGPRSLWYRILPTGKHRRDLQYQLGELTRYLDENGIELQRKMMSLIQRRDDLDFQSAIHNRIRFFATIHTVLLGAFIVFTAGHVVAAHMYSSHW
ncbi:MAG: hypothetical protein MUC43_18145 [Pirellula sp.]|nr:hypothetical protein [Pirellula sp.]